MVIQMHAPEDIKQAADAPRCECADKHVYYQALENSILVIELCHRCKTVEPVDELRAA